MLSNDEMMVLAEMLSDPTTAAQHVAATSQPHPRDYFDKVVEAINEINQLLNSNDHRCCGIMVHALFNTGEGDDTRCKVIGASIGDSSFAASNRLYFHDVSTEALHNVLKGVKVREVTPVDSTTTH